MFTCEVYHIGGEGVFLNKRKKLIRQFLDKGGGEGGFEKFFFFMDVISELLLVHSEYFFFHKLNFPQGHLIFLHINKFHIIRWMRQVEIFYTTVEYELMKLFVPRIKYFWICQNFAYFLVRIRTTNSYWCMSIQFPAIRNEYLILYKIAKISQLIW